MKLYKMLYTNELFDVLTEWFASKRDASDRRHELFKSASLTGRKIDHVIIVHDIPANKAGLLRFLNEECRLAQSH